MLPVLTIGHSTRTLEDFLELLRIHSVERIADVRTVPRSRRNPQFNRESLPAGLAQAGIGYVHLPGLGGLRHPRPDSTNNAWENLSFRGYADYMQTAGFEAALDELLALAARERTCVMCAESVPWRCHRSLIADALTARGIEAGHIMGKGPAQRHKMTPFARVEGTRVSYPGAQRPLFGA